MSSSAMLETQRNPATITCSSDIADDSILALFDPQPNLPGIMVSDENDEDDIRCRRLRFFSLDEESGDYVSDLIQSEMMVVNGVVSHSHLRMPYYGVMASLLLLSPDVKRVMILGNGAGALSSFLANASYPRISVIAVEIDPRVVCIASTYFNNKADNLQIIEGDAIDCLNRVNSVCCDAIIIDVSGQGDSDLIAPSADFLGDDAIKIMQRAIDPKCGAMMFNLLFSQRMPLQCRINASRLHAEHLAQMFPSVCLCTISQSDNMILYASNDKQLNETHILQCIRSWHEANEGVAIQVVPNIDITVFT